MNRLLLVGIALLSAGCTPAPAENNLPDSKERSTILGRDTWSTNDPTAGTTNPQPLEPVDLSVPDKYRDDPRENVAKAMKVLDSEYIELRKTISLPGTPPETIDLGAAVSLDLQNNSKIPVNEAVGVVTFVFKDASKKPETYKDVILYHRPGPIKPGKKGPCAVSVKDSPDTQTVDKVLVYVTWAATGFK